MSKQEFIEEWLETVTIKESLDDEIIHLIEKSYNEDDGKFNNSLLYNELLKKSKDKE
mgnify:CR=1 FL=1